MRLPRTDTSESTGMTVLVTRAEYPALFRELIALPKGKARANRIRALASLGLQLETGGALASRQRARDDLPVRAEPEGENAGFAAAAQMFGHATAD